MTKIEQLLQEYNTRFKVTKKIKKDGYPFPTGSLFNSGQMEPRVTPTHICSKNGVVYQHHTLKPPTWATAEVKIKPQQWVVEKDETNPLWEKFIAWLEAEMDIDGFYKTYTIGTMVAFMELKSLKIHTYFSDSGPVGSLAEAGKRGCQYLTLEQWAEFFLPNVDFSILNANDWFYLEIKGYKWLIKGGLVNKDKLYGYAYSYDFLSEELKRGNGYFSKRGIKLLRKATDGDLATMFEKYPELAPPKVGDWGVFWDTGRFEEKVISQIKSIDIVDSSRRRGDTVFTAMNDTPYDFFEKIDAQKPLQPKIDFLEFLLETGPTIISGPIKAGRIKVGESITDILNKKS